MQEVPEPGLSQKHHFDIEPALVNAAGAAAMLNISVATFHRLLSSGRIGPQKIRLASKCVRFSIQELREWSRSGCPSREQWARRRHE